MSWMAHRTLEHLIICHDEAICASKVGSSGAACGRIAPQTGISRVRKKRSERDADAQTRSTPLWRLRVEFDPETPWVGVSCGDLRAAYLRLCWFDSATGDTRGYKGICASPSVLLFLSTLTLTIFVHVSPFSFTEMLVVY